MLRSDENNCGLSMLGPYRRCFERTEIVMRNMFAVYQCSGKWKAFYRATDIAFMQIIGLAKPGPKLHAM